MIATLKIKALSDSNVDLSRLVMVDLMPKTMNAKLVFDLGSGIDYDSQPPIDSEEIVLVVGAALTVESVSSSPISDDYLVVEVDMANEIGDLLFSNEETRPMTPISDDDLTKD